MPAYYERIGEGRFACSPATAGPWSPDSQHGGPPSALLGGAMAAAGAREDMMVARVTCEILGPITMADLELSVRVTRPGRRVERVEGALSQAGRTVLAGSAWRILRTESATPTSDPPPPVPESRDLLDAPGYFASVDWAPLTGSFSAPGPCVMWTRLRSRVVADQEPTPLERVLAVADSGNGISQVVPLATTYFINPELTVHLHREPVGEWVLLDATTVVSAGGVGLAISTLSDPTGQVGRGAQSLLIAPR